MPACMPRLADSLACAIVVTDAGHMLCRRPLVTSQTQISLIPRTLPFSPPCRSRGLFLCVLLLVAGWQLEVGRTQLCKCIARWSRGLGVKQGKHSSLRFTSQDEITDNTSSIPEVFKTVSSTLHQMKQTILLSFLLSAFYPNYACTTEFPPHTLAGETVENYQGGS